jgi:nucleoid DNA-binding protein
MAGLAELSKVSGVKTEEVKAVLDAISTIAATESVICKGFGTFKTNHRAEREGRNPQTGAALTIPAKSVLAFKPSK